MKKPIWYRALGRQPLGSLLDAACGDGSFAEELLVEGQGLGSLLGFDPDPNAVQEAGSHFAEHAPPDLVASFVQASIASFYAEAAPAGRLFDTVAMQDALHHLRVPEEDLARLWALVRPGGRLILSEVYSDGLNPAQQSELELHELKAAVDRIVGIDHFHVLDRERIGRIFETATDGATESFLLEPAEAIRKSEVLEARLEWLDSYMLHAAGHRDYASLRKKFARVAPKLRQTGLGAAARIIYILRKESPQAGRGAIL